MHFVSLFWETGCNFALLFKMYDFELQDTKNSLKGELLPKVYCTALHFKCTLTVTTLGDKMKAQDENAV